MSLATLETETTRGTTHLQPGDVVYTTLVDGEDFGIPLVGPTRSIVPKRREQRVVRNHLHVRGGVVVWFEDGTKTRPLHGRTAWVLVGGG